MKIEVGESLVYSWLRHVGKFQVVQTNWKSSPGWSISNKADIVTMFDELKKHFGNELFKGTVDVDQFLQQGECDLFATRIEKGVPYYAVSEVAFHSGRLKYGSKNETIMKVTAKCVRAAFCLLGYFDSKNGEIFFASPFVSAGKGIKTASSIKSIIDSNLVFLENYFKAKGFSFSFRLICNDDFEDEILAPTLKAIESAEDTAELFARSVKMLEMFPKTCIKIGEDAKNKNNNTKNDNQKIIFDILNGLKTHPNYQQILLELQDPAQVNALFKNSTYPLLQNEATCPAGKYKDKGFYTGKNAIFIEGNDRYLVCRQFSPKSMTLLQDWYNSL